VNQRGEISGQRSVPQLHQHLANSPSSIRSGPPQKPARDCTAQVHTSRHQYSQRVHPLLQAGEMLRLFKHLREKQAISKNMSVRQPKRFSTRSRVQYASGLLPHRGPTVESQSLKPPRLVHVDHTLYTTLVLPRRLACS
jgi:hypothetical protein